MPAERDRLLPLAGEGFDLASLHFPQVNQSGWLKVLTNFYSVPLQMGATVEVKVYSAYVEIWHAGQRVARHERCYRRRRSFPPMGKKQTGSSLGTHSRLSSVRMSRSRLFLRGSVSTGARFRFIGCAQNAVQWSCRSSNLQRTANQCLIRLSQPRGPPQ
jgi:hypothetical protein